MAVLLALTACSPTVAVPAASSATAASSAPESSAAAGSPASFAGEATSAAVATRVLDLRDASRPTDPTPGDVGTDAVPGRSLPTTLWYPASGDGPFPVVVFSHGLGAAPDSYATLLSSWAAAGFVVAAPTFPLTSRNSPRLGADVANQPADVSFVLSAVLALNTTQGDPLRGRIDTADVAVAGHSAGAITTIGLLSPCCVDPRVTAAVVLAGSTLHFGADLARPGVPTLFVHGLTDPVLPIAEDRKVFASATAPAAFLQLTSGGHSGPYDDPSDPAYDTVQATTTDFLQWALAGDPDALMKLRRDATADGVATLAADRLPH